MDDNSALAITVTGCVSALLCAIVVIVAICSHNSAMTARAAFAAGLEEVNDHTQSSSTHYGHK